MLLNKVVRISAIFILVMFTGFCLTGEFSFANDTEPDPVLKAKELAEKGDYDAAIEILEECVKNLIRQSADGKKMAVVYYTLARIYYTVGEDQLAEMNLKWVFENDVDFQIDERDFVFSKKIERIKKEVQKKQDSPKVETEKQDDKVVPETETKEQFEAPVDKMDVSVAETKEKMPESHKKVISKKTSKTKKKKFPWLLVLGGAAIVVALILILGNKSSGNGGTSSQSTYYLNVTQFPDSEVTGNPNTGNHPYPSGQIVNYNYSSTQGNEFIYAILDDVHVGRSGTIVMNMNHELKALSVNNILQVDGSRIQGWINYDGDQDWYVFRQGSTGTVTIYTEYYPADRIDTVMYLYSVDNPNSAISSDDDGGDELCSKIITSLSAGFYLVRIHEYSDNSTGGYYIRVRSGSYSFPRESIKKINGVRSDLKVKYLP